MYSTACILIHYKKFSVGSGSSKKDFFGEERKTINTLLLGKSYKCYKLCKMIGNSLLHMSKGLAILCISVATYKIQLT